jgi:VCBS repeat-containing protein
LINPSWLSALQTQFSGKKKSSRTRDSQSQAAEQATQATEGLEERTLMTVNALNDTFAGSAVNEDDVFSPDAEFGVLANDPAGNGTRVASQVGNNPAVTVNPDGSFTFDPSLIPNLQALQHGETQQVSFGYEVTDNDGPGSTASATLTILGLNDPTTATNATQSHTYDENQGSPVALDPIVASDPDANDQITATLNLSDSAAGTLAAPGAVFANGSLTVTGTVADVNAALATLTFTPNAGYHQDFHIGVNLSDGLEDGATAATGKISMTLIPAPGRPVASDGGFTINEDSGTHNSILVGSVSTATDPLNAPTFGLAGTAATKGVVTITDPVTGAFTYTPNANANGTDTFQFQVTDSHGVTSAMKTVTVTINPVNDVPRFHVGPDQTVIEDAGNQSTTFFATNVLPASLDATDEFNQTIDFIVTNDNNALFSEQPTISSVGTLVFKGAPNASGSAVVTVRIHDNGGTANGGVDTSETQTFTIHITPVEDAPVASDIEVSLPENSTVGTVVGTISGSDADPGNTLTYSILTGNSSGTFAINPTTGQITVANNALLDFETSPTINLIVKVTDNTNRVGTANVLIHLTNVNDPLKMQLPSATQTYVKRGGEVAIDPAASISDQDTANLNFNGGTLRVSNPGSDSTDSHDRLGIMNQGAGTGTILVKGDKVYYESTANQIGTIITGKNGGPLLVNLTAGATQTAVNALLKAVSFRNTSDTPKVGTRNVLIELSDASGAEHAQGTKQVRVTKGTAPPVLTLTGNSMVYTNKAAPVAIDQHATLTDPDSPNLKGGKLTVSITQGVNTNNRLSVLNVGGVTVSGKDVSFNGHKIGRLTVGSNSLSVSFNDVAATPEAAQAVMRAIAFATAQANTSLSDRLVQIHLTDGDGGTSQTVSMAIHVSNASQS